MNRTFQQTYHLPGTLTANIDIRFTAHTNMSLLHVSAVASPTAGLMFTNDTMPIKVRFFFATGPVDYRGLYKANVA